MSDSESVSEMHQQVLENTYLFLEVLDQVSSSLAIDRRFEIAPAIARTEEHLSRSYGGEELAFDDYKDICKLAEEIGKSIWNPKGDTFAQRIAVFGINNHQIAKNLENESGSELIEAPQPFWKRLIEERIDLLETQTDALTPKQRVDYEASLRSVNGGLEANERLGDIEMAGEAKARRMAPERLPRLNVEFVDKSALRVWAQCSGKVGALPKEPGILIDALKDLEVGGFGSKEMRAVVAKAWGQSQPKLSPEWIDHATNAIVGSATSTMLDSSEMRSSTFVRKVFEDIYNGPEVIPGLQVESEIAPYDQSRNDLISTLASLDATLKGLSESKSGHQVLASMLTQLSREAETLRDLVERARDQWDADGLTIDGPR